jgi:hypothetical protein
VRWALGKPFTRASATRVQQIGEGFGGHRAPPRDTRIWESIQLCTSDEIHATARPPRLMEEGNSPHCILK